MYKIENKSNLYYVQSIRKNNKHLIGDENNLIDYLVRYYVKIIYQNSNGIIVDYEDVNFSGKDTKRYIPLFSYENADLSLRNIVFLDGENRIIDIRKFDKKVKNRTAELVAQYGYLNYAYRYYENSTNNDELEYGDVLIKKTYRGKIEYRYRIDPVPFICNYNNGPYQHKKYRRIIAMIKNPENKGYVRKSHYESVIEGAYDWEYYNNRTNTKSWKDNKKCKKQWQKNL